MLVCDPAGAVTYGPGSGINNINSANYSYWSTMLSNNDSTVTVNINVYSGTLNLSNATIRMSSGKSINIKNGATVNIINGSAITHSSGYYYFIYENGSTGNLDDSTFEYSYKLQIATKKNLTITNCSIHDNWEEGIFLTATSGYVNITNCNIYSNNEQGIYLTSTTGHVNILNCTITDCGDKSIHIESSGSNILRNNNINDTDRSLYITGNYENDIDTTNYVNGGVVYYRYNIDNFSIIGNQIGHITLYNCSNISIKDNTIVTNGDGIRLIDSITNVTIDNNLFNDSNYYGIVISSSSANIRNNIITTSDTTSISLFDSNNTYIINNSVSGGEQYASGIALSNSKNNNLTGNNITGTGGSGNGIALSSSSNSNDIISNTITCGGGYHGISLDGSSYNNIISNTVKNRGNSGLYLSGNSNYCTVLDNVFTDNSDGGITIESSHSKIFDNNICSNLGGSFSNMRSGVTVLSGTNNSISSNNISYNLRNGITVASSGNRFSDNILIGNGDNGVYIQIDNNTFSNNTISIGGAAGYGFYIDFGQYDNYIYQNNTVNGEKIYYYFANSTIQTVSPGSLTAVNVSNVGKISLIKCSNFEIKGNTLSNNRFIDGGIPSGIFLYNSSNIIISDNTISDNYQGIHLYNSSNNVLNNTNRINKSEDSGIYFNISGYNNITNNDFTSNSNCGINFNCSDHNNIIGNTIAGSHDGILFTTSLNNNLYTNNIINYSLSIIRLNEYSQNNFLIGNIHSLRNGAEFDIHINDSDNNIIAPNWTVAANYTFYLTGDTRLVTLDTIFNKTDVGYEDTSNLTLMWRIDVLSWDNKHIEPIWGNFTVRYGDYSDVGGMLVYSGTVSNANGRLSNNPTDYWGPPDSDDNWLPVIEYKENASVRINYQSMPMNCSVINKWDELQGINKSYQNITATITGPGVTIIVDAGYTPNGKCYYCHLDKLSFINMIHWTEYSEKLIDDLSDPYTPGRCIDCHDKNDTVSVPHSSETGKDLLVQQSPGLCYNGNGNQTCHNSSAVRATLNQEVEFDQTTHHQLGEGKLSCFACHDNHGTNYRYDLHRFYTNVTQKPYNSNDYQLCFVCHLEEKFKAKMVGESDAHLSDYTNQTNFRDEYWWGVGFLGGTPNNYNVHNGHFYTCYKCHNPHGSDNPVTTRPPLTYKYISNLTAPGDEDPDGDWLNQTILSPSDWNNSTLNQGGGLNNPYCGGCHGARLPNNFIYREYVDYKAAGGPGCVECHDSSRPEAIRKIINVSAIKLAMHNNLSWAFRNGGILQGTVLNWTQWGAARNYNSSNISTDNAICWACHSSNGTPPYPGFHPDRTLNPYKCAKCHGPNDGQPPHTQGLVKAIDNHGPTTKGVGSIYIQTDMGRNGSCEDCHAPSKLPENLIGNLEVWKFGTSRFTMGWKPYTGRSTMGDVCHYGLSKSQGQAFGIENPLFDTSDCLYCHCNSTSGAIWGNAPNISGNMYGADTSNLSECYLYCHVLPDYVGIVDETNILHFHNRTLYAGGGPDCVVCHDVNGTYQVQSLVNTSSIARGMHANITNNTIELILNIDPRSKPCWGCHQSDGTEPEGMGDRNGIVDPSKRPWTCEDCHCRSSEWVAATDNGATWLASSYPPNRLPPRIYAHHPNSSSVITNMNGTGRCVDCHNNSVDPYHNDMAQKVLGNTIFSNVSHYGLNKLQGLYIGITNPLVNTSDCAVCHNSTANASIWGGATQNKHGNFNNYSADDGCFICHTTDNQTPVDFHAGNLIAGTGGFECLKCHNTAGFSRNRRINDSMFSMSIHNRLNNASTMEYGLNRSCWTCHFENAINTDNHSNRMDPPYLCYDCHGPVPAYSNVSNAPAVYNHFKEGNNISAYKTQDNNSKSCMGCHNKSEMFYSYLPDENETIPYYTNFSITSHYGSNRTDLVNKYDDANSTEYCSYCHVNGSSPFMEYANDRNITHTGNKDCNDCHGKGRLHNETLTRPTTGGNCTDCHLEGGLNATAGMPVINKTGFISSVHRNLTGKFSIINYTQLSQVCWGCHVNYTQQLVNDSHSKPATELPICEDCHDNATPLNFNYLNQTPLQVREHQSSGEDIITNSSIANCISCHNKSLTIPPPLINVKYPGAKNYISHYGKQRTDLWLSENNKTITNCSYCHLNGGNEFNNVFADPLNIANITHGGNCSVCHGTGRIHNVTLTRPSISGNCTDCHLEGGINATGTLPIINKTGFFNGIHRNITGEFSTTNYSKISRVCWGCHVNYTQQLINGSHTKSASDLPKCEDCHDYATPLNFNYLNQTPLQVREHQPFGEDIITNSSIANCTSCHNKSLTIPPPSNNVKYPRAKNYISHYGRQRTDLWFVENNKIITNCSYCHLNGGNEFNDMFTDPLVSANITHGVNCTGCHGSARIHNASLKVPAMTPDNEACLYCHNNMTNKHISASDFWTSAHQDLNCINCHTPRQVFEGYLINSESQIFNFNIPPEVTSLNGTFDWTGSGILNLTLFAPDANYTGTLINISSPTSGNWSAIISGTNVDARFTVTINASMSHPGSIPKNCEDCHVYGFDGAPLVYKHLTNQSSVPTTTTCVSCHSIGAYAAVTSTIAAAHYATLEPLDTENCIQCHTGIEEGWGNPPDQRNHTHYVFVEKTLAAGNPWVLVDNYSLTLIETTSNAAMFAIKKDGKLLEHEYLSLGNELEFEISGIESKNTSIFNFTVAKIFKSENQYVVELSGSVLASRIHRETDNNECYACHDSEYRTDFPDGRDYYVLKKDTENVTLGLMPVNFEEHDQKMLRIGEYWDLGENYSLYVADIEFEESNTTRLQLYRNETLLEDLVIDEGNNFTHEARVLSRKINVFSASIDSVFTGTDNQFIILENVRLVAGEQITLDATKSVMQTNTLLKYLPLDCCITIGKEPETFHVYTLTPGEYSSDCISCHAENGVAPIKIDMNKFENGVHPNLNQNETWSSFISDERNKACWACHWNGSEPTEHPVTYPDNRPPKTCIVCHAYSHFSAPQIYAHYPGSEISTDATCWDCHSNTITNSSPENVKAGTSHYSTREDLLNASQCDICHNNETNAPKWGAAPQITKHNAVNNCTLCHAGEGLATFHDQGIVITRNCDDCHVDKQQADQFNLSPIITHYPGAPEDSVNTLKRNQYTCRVCHNATNETLHTNLEVREYQNETMGYCFPCHSVEGEFPHKSKVQITALKHGTGIKVISGCEACHSPEGVSRFHTPTLIGKGYFKGPVRHDIECKDCHEPHKERKYQPYEGIQCSDCHSEYGNVHYTGAQVEMANKTTTCELCHNEEADEFHNLTSFVGNVTDAAYEPCLDCHEDIESLKEHIRSLKIIGGTMATISHPVEESTITCSSCHNATGKNRFHFDTYPLGTVQDPGWQNWTAGNVTGCKDCHTYHGGDSPFNATNMGTQGLSPAGTAHGLAPNCTLCHGGDDPISFHTLATTEFIPRLAITLNPDDVFRGKMSLLQAAVVLPPLTKVTRAEYFIDEMGQEGFGEPLEFIVGESTDSSVLLGAMMDTADMSPGKHLIFVHVKDSSGKWSKVEIAALTVRKPIGLAFIEVLLKDVIPVVAFIALMYFIWRRFR